MKQIPLLQGNALLIELPKQDFIKAKIQTLVDLHTVWSGKLNFKNGDRWESVSLPPGNWRIIGMLNEVTEEDLTEIIDVLVSSESGKKLYPNFTGGPWKVNRIESLDSAILAENWYFENPVKIHTWVSENADDYRKQWEEGKKRVLSRERCLLLRRVEE